MWVRGYASRSSGDSLHVRLAGETLALTGFTLDEWHWSNLTVEGTTAQLTVTPGLHTLNLLMREDGLRVDRVLLITDTNYIPTDNGPAESPRSGDPQVWQPDTGTPDNLLAYAPALNPKSKIQNPKSPNPITTSPFAMAPGLMLLVPLAVAGPLARRRRLAWAIALALLLVVLVGVGTAFAMVESDVFGQEPITYEHSTTRSLSQAQSSETTPLK